MITIASVATNSAGSVVWVQIDEKGEKTGPTGKAEKPLASSLDSHYKMHYFLCRGRPKTDFRDYRAPRDRNSYSPGRDYPPLKRMRGDYDDGRSRYAGKYT